METNHKQIHPVALGIILDPPTLVLSYDEIISGTGGPLKKKRRKRKMPLRGFTDRSNVEKVAFSMKLRHKPYLDKVLPLTVQKMMKIIQELLKGLRIQEAISKVDREYEIHPEENLNNIAPQELAQKVEIMDEVFLKKVIKPGDPDYVYDKVEKFDTSGQAPSEWDDEFEFNSNQNLTQNLSQEDNLKDGDQIENLENSAIDLNAGDENITEFAESIVNDCIEKVPIPPEDTEIGVEIKEDKEIKDDGFHYDSDEENWDKMLVAICDGTIDNDKLVSICDLDVKLPFGGDGDSVFTNLDSVSIDIDIDKPQETDTNIDDNGDKESSGPGRSRIYLSNDEEDKDKSNIKVTFSENKNPDQNVTEEGGSSNLIKNNETWDILKDVRTIENIAFSTELKDKEDKGISLKFKLRSDDKDDFEDLGDIVAVPVPPPKVPSVPTWSALSLKTGFSEDALLQIEQDGETLLDDDDFWN